MKISSPSKYKSKKKKEPNNYAIFNPSFLWDKGTEDEKAYPTLEMIYVQPQDRGKGIGKRLVQAVLEHMRKEKINYCVFNNYEKYFWNIIFKETKGLVVFPVQHKKRIGILRVDVSINVENII